MQSNKCVFIVLVFVGFLNLVNGEWTGDEADGKTLTQKIRERVPINRTIVVDQSGKGDFRSVQAAIDAVPVMNTQWIIIHIRRGVYWEKVHIPHHKPYIFMRGNGRGRTAITWSHNSVDNTESATFRAEAPNFIAFGITFKNEAPTGTSYTSSNQSVAVLVGSDMAAFYHCSFLSTHNSLFDAKGRHYFDNCYIQGSLDFIFGRATSIYHECDIFVMGGRRLDIHSSITAHHRETPQENTGFVFIKAKVFGVRDVYLGRARGAYSRVIYAESYLSKTIMPEGWTKWTHPLNTDNIYQGEYKCFGPGAVTKDRVPWSKQLTDEEVAPFLSIDFIGGSKWLAMWR